MIKGGGEVLDAVHLDLHSLQGLSKCHRVCVIFGRRDGVSGARGGRLGWRERLTG